MKNLGCTLHKSMVFVKLIWDSAKLYGFFSLRTSSFSPSWIVYFFLTWYFFTIYFCSILKLLGLLSSSWWNLFVFSLNHVIIDGIKERGERCERRKKIHIAMLKRRVKRRWHKPWWKRTMRPTSHVDNVKKYKDNEREKLASISLGNIIPYMRTWQP